MVIINISGKFASGKSTVIELLCQAYNYKKVITCTTRKQRDNERDGIDYYFFTKEQFSEAKNSGNLIAVNEVKDEKGNVTKEYGLPISKINFDEDILICPLEPNGYNELIEKFGRDIVKCIYLNISDKERFFRVLNRESNPDMESYCLRFLEENETFREFDLKVDKVIKNDGTSDMAAKEIHEYIQSLLKK